MSAHRQTYFVKRLDRSHGGAFTVDAAFGILVDPDERFLALINRQHQAICKIDDYRAILNIIIILMDSDERFPALIIRQHQAVCKIAVYTAILHIIILMDPNERFAALINRQHQAI